MRIRSGVVAVMALFAAVAQVQAARLSQTSGVVLVSSGQGFKSVSAGAELPVGSQVMAQVGGQATVTYSQVCTIFVMPGKVHTVGAAAPCATQVKDASNCVGGSLKDAGMCGAAAGAAGPGGAANAAGVGTGALGDPLVAGTLLTAAGVGAGVLIYKATRPASP